MKKEKSKKEPVTEEKKYHSIGLTGNHEQINMFRGIIKMKGERLGVVLIEVLTEYNKKHK